MLDWFALIRSFLSSSTFTNWDKTAVEGCDASMLSTTDSSSSLSSSFMLFCSYLLPPLIKLRSSLTEPIPCGSSQLGTSHLEVFCYRYLYLLQSRRSCLSSRDCWHLAMKQNYLVVTPTRCCASSSSSFMGLRYSRCFGPSVHLPNPNPGSNSLPCSGSWLKTTMTTL